MLQDSISVSRSQRPLIKLRRSHPSPGPSLRHPHPPLWHHQMQPPPSQHALRLPRAARGLQQSEPNSLARRSSVQDRPLAFRGKT
ncbi:uncharacterized protein BDW70DRAFT_128224 [Aspergillus foveolatus]|uniref:uncharacterized protein n=1 Tax=Aspergillus foveolatus TaxID=210207 RepID=UPI003CCCD116